jgi:hypothetical protein
MAVARREMTRVIYCVRTATAMLRIVAGEGGDSRYIRKIQKKLRQLNQLISFLSLPSHSSCLFFA